MRRGPLLSILILVFLALGVPAFFAPPARAQLTDLLKQNGNGNGEAQPAQPAEPVVTAESVKDKQKALADEIKAAEGQVAAIGEGPVPDALRNRLETLRRIDSLLAQQLSALGRIPDAQQAKADLESQLTTLQEQGPPGDRPFPISALDRARDDAVAERDRDKAAADRVDQAQKALETARTALETAEKARRGAKEAAAGAGEGPQGADLVIAANRAELEARAAAETLTLRRLELDAAKLDRETEAVRLKIAEETLNWINRETRFTEKELNDQLKSLDDRREELEKTKAETAAPALAEAVSVEDRRRKRIGNSTAPADVEELTALRMQREAAQEAVDVIDKRLARIEDRKRAWERRFSVYHDLASNKDIALWRDEARSAVTRYDADRNVTTTKINIANNDTRDLDRRIEDPQPPDDQLVETLKAQRAAAEARISALRDDLTSLETSIRVQKLLLGQIETEQATITFGERLSSLWHGVTGVWTYEFFSVDDKPITAGKIFTGLILLIAGFWASRRVSNFLGRRVFPHFGLNEGASAAMRSIVFYLFVILVTLAALKAVNVPLTVFTILGGAVAIGIGFGSQNIANNFISGLIILAERPIRVGDMVQFEEVMGIVGRIGARSTRVTTFDNIELIVPNSTIIQANVTNWTLSDHRVRGHVRVGVAYGSPTRDVANLLLKAADDHGRILTKPEPYVWFSDFGDNALVFDLYFWVEVRKLADRRTIESDARHRIDNLFRSAGITIAFPQRDVHLDHGTSPIRVQIEPAPPTEEGTGE